MIENNICLLTDSYKVTHHYFYPKGTEKIYSYLESRLGSEFNKTIFYGLQYIIKKYLEGSVVNQQKIEEADKLISNHIGEDIFNKDGWYYILDNYDGYLPIEIKAVPEGTPVNVSNVLMSVENTDKKSFWLVNYLESLLLQVWYPSTVATLSAEVRKLSKFYLEVTGSSKDNLDFMLHDFGYRGASSTESSMLAGSAHLLSFSGTDTIPALLIPKNYYNDSNLYGFSVQATEHSVMTSLGPKGEFDQILNVGLLWGDGLDYHKIRDILFAMKSNGWAAENIIFGMGGGLHTSVNRDTQRNAFKCSAQLRDGKWFDIYKNPLDSSKKSKTGRFKLINENNSFKTISIDGYGENYLRTVFKNGELLIEDTFADIKSKALNYSNFL
ncbi:nicotinate phosphoribosyltransferase [Methanobrevibacter gottschalkii]|uniref:nicotinate phosphoribosyltransferase n=1 Tax=Methanobrevibacter gottschalkii TaxID=190974 RepID=UPI0038D0284A